MRSRATWFDRDAKPIDVYNWTMLNRDESYKRLAHDQVGPYWVSTVWLGIDHGFSENGPPVIFETMVFATDDETPTLGPELDMRRYCTEGEALQGHEDMVTLIRATLVDVEAWETE